MNFPAGTRWSVAVFDNNGSIGSFDPTPWTFGDGTMAAEGIWTGTYQQVLPTSTTIQCHISTNDDFAVVFITPTRFIATKSGNLYRFGKLL